VRLITRGSKVGPCNICGTHGPLTEDHIPPKGVSRLGQVAMMNIIDLLSVQRPKKSTRFSQDGVKYRTLCKKCNNERLGLGFDPVLISLASSVRAYLESALHLPSEMQIQTKPNRLVRSVVGHLLAHGVGEHKNGLMIERLTDYFLDEGLAFPQELKLYYWVYPFNDQVIVKGASVSLHYWNSFAVIMLLKFFPLSFFFVLDEPSEWRLPFRRLDTMLSNRIDDESIVSVDFTGLPPQRWPEAPGTTGMVLHGEGAIGAIPRVS
jgi:hypothetical protein